MRKGSIRSGGFYFEFFGLRRDSVLYTAYHEEGVAASGEIAADGAVTGAGGVVTTEDVQDAHAELAR